MMDTLVTVLTMSIAGAVVMGAAAFVLYYLVLPVIGETAFRLGQLLDKITRK